MEDVLDGGVDISRAVVSDAALHSRRQLALDLLHLDAGTFDDVDRVGVWQNENAHEDGALPGETDLGVVIFGAKHDVGDVAQPDEGSAGFANDEILEILDRVLHPP